MNVASRKIENFFETDDDLVGLVAFSLYARGRLSTGSQIQFRLESELSDSDFHAYRSAADIGIENFKKRALDRELELVRQSGSQDEFVRVVQENAGAILEEQDSRLTEIEELIERAISWKNQLVFAVAGSVLSAFLIALVIAVAPYVSDPLVPNRPVEVANGQ
jgi:hypothetical protein